MNISNQHSILVSNMHLAEAQRVIRDRQDQAVKNGWRPQAGQPNVATQSQGDKTKLIFEYPQDDLERLKQELQVIDRLIDFLKDVGNLFESIGRKLWPF